MTTTDRATRSTRAPELRPNVTPPVDREAPERAGRPSPGRARRRLPGTSTARARIIGWVLLLVLVALAALTFVTWRLLISATDTRMDAALRYEFDEFSALIDSGLDPATGLPFASVDQVLASAITYNLARENEKFLGYVDGGFRWESRAQSPVRLSQDAEFTALVGAIGVPTSGSYASRAGEVLYLAVPVALVGDPARGTIVVAYFADQERAAADSAAQLMLLVGGITMLGAAAGAWLVAGQVLRPLRDVAATARTITDTDLSGRIPTHGASEGDELGDLVRTVNAMLDRVETGVDAQRRFLDDAGHELRTPITIVRGHLEVLDPADVDDVRDTVALADDELGRMNRMVSDMLLLARSEQPSFLRPGPVDVAALTQEVFGKVTGLGDRDWGLGTTARVDAVLDPQRITQALVALADNARRYTAPGDRIEIGSLLTGNRLRFWVCDSGPGVTAEDRARIFERFARGAAGGPRSDGAGLGLSIVRAIAVAHGGQVVLDSVPGRGATFTVEIPAIVARAET